MKSNISRIARVVASLLVLMVAMPVPGRADSQEARWGAQIYNYLAGQRIIVDSHSPLYDVLNPIAMPLKAVADPLYDAPFLFTIGRDPYPNVEAVPGGRVYVSDKALGTIRYREELAGALCHAVAHTVRHDGAKKLRADTNASLGGLALFLLLVSDPNSPLLGLRIPTSIDDAQRMVDTAKTGGAILDATKALTALKAESDADLMGADLCAKAGLNPWGLVWLLQNYQKSKMGGRMEMLPDFPADRIRRLEAHLTSEPGVFAKFDRDRTHGTLLRP